MYKSECENIFENSFLTNKSAQMNEITFNINAYGINITSTPVKLK